MHSVRVHVDGNHFACFLPSYYAQYAAARAHVQNAFTFCHVEVFGEEKRVFRGVVYVFINNKRVIAEKDPLTSQGHPPTPRILAETVLALAFQRTERCEPA